MNSFFLFVDSWKQKKYTHKSVHIVNHSYKDAFFYWNLFFCVLIHNTFQFCFDFFIALSPITFLSSREYVCVCSLCSFEFLFRFSDLYFYKIKFVLLSPFVEFSFSLSLLLCICVCVRERVCVTLIRMKRVARAKREWNSSICVKERNAEKKPTKQTKATTKKLTVNSYTQFTYIVHFINIRVLYVDMEIGFEKKTERKQNKNKFLFCFVVHFSIRFFFICGWLVAVGIYKCLCIYLQYDHVKMTHIIWGCESTCYVTVLSTKHKSTKLDSCIWSDAKYAPSI